MIGWGAYGQRSVAAVRKRIDINSKRLPEQILDLAIEASVIGSCPFEQELMQLGGKPQGEAL